MIPRLHLVTDDRVLAASDFHRWAREAVEVGGDRVALHLRGPGTSGRRLWELGRALRSWLREKGTPLVVNDRVDVALTLGADGIHLGGRSLTIGSARALVGEAVWIGRSVHGTAEAEEVHRERGEVPDRAGLDFVFAGTIFESASHPGRPAGGPARVQEVQRVLPDVPVLGIGGVTPDGVAAIMEAGGHGVAVIRAIWDAGRPAEAVAAFLGHLGRSDREGSLRGPREETE